jgi:metal-responsive CopG/Arc/MetJ family transcriptional regulator
MSTPFSLRLPDPVRNDLDAFAREYSVHRSQVIVWACEAYVKIVRANGDRMLSAGDIQHIVHYVSTRAAAMRQAAEPPPIFPAHGGHSTVPKPACQPTTTRKLSA